MSFMLGVITLNVVYVVSLHRALSMLRGSLMLIMLSVSTLSVVYSEYHYAECRLR